MQTIRLLIVDDEPALCWSLASFMEEFGHEVTVAESAEEALGILNTIDFDAGIIDLRLPGMSGDKLIPEAHKLQPDMVFLIHTGSSDYTVSPEVEAVGLSKHDVFMKPLEDMTVLQDRLECILKKGN